jgi:DNA-binding transcriptional LysR family regulator
MDRLDAMRIFAAVADAQGFAPAARSLRLSAPAVTRAVAALEDRLGARLLHRTTRVVRLTEAGAHFLADCKRILGEVEEAEAAATGSHTELRGPLAITAPLMFGRLHVAPIVLDFLKRHPAVVARALYLDRVTDLVEEGIDAAVRIGPLPDSSLTAIRVGSMRRIVCAAPAYLRAHGTPRMPADLADHDAIAFGGTTPLREWSFDVDGKRRGVTPRVRLEVNSAEVAVAAATAGQGVTRVLYYQAARELRAGKLRVVLPEFEPPPLPVQVVHAEGRRVAARVRAFIDFATKRLRVNPLLR